MKRRPLHNDKQTSPDLLVSGNAHEVGNLINCITINTPILREYLKELIPIIDNDAKDYQDFELFGMSYSELRKDIFKILDTIAHASSRITDTASNLKNFFQRNFNKDRECVEVREVIDKAVAICRGQMSKTVKTFDVHIAEDLPPIFADHGALEQVLINLFINASQAADKEDSWVTLNAKEGNTLRNHLIIEVSDNGCGMDEATMAKVFDPFFTTKAHINGSGLGLFVSKNLVEGLGGHISVKSKASLGSTFRINLTT